MYYQREDDEKMALLTTYVDDRLLTGNYEAEIRIFAEYLLGTCEERDLGLPDKTGVSIYRRRNGGDRARRDGFNNRR